MSMEYTIYCDDCLTLIDASEKSESYARRRAVDEGLMVRIGKRDVCINCAETAPDNVTTAVSQKP